MTTHLKSILDQHEIIAWDMDSTLIGAHNSDFFRAYIMQNPRKQHYIITFRDYDWAQEIWEELTACGDIDTNLIISVEYCPIEMSDVAQFIEWKGKCASELGCTLLVDDRPSWVIKGCIKYGVAFLDALS